MCECEAITLNMLVLASSNMFYYQSLYNELNEREKNPWRTTRDESTRQENRSPKTYIDAKYSFLTVYRPPFELRQ